MHKWPSIGNKFKARRTMVDGKSFPSHGEAQLYAQLKFLEKNGDIKEVTCYPTVTLTEAEIRWKIDMQYFCNKRNRLIYAEFKGCEMETYLLKKKLYKHYGKEILEVYKANKRGIYLDETITPKGAA